MLPDAKYYDVWIIKANQVIREIPAATIVQWIEERRLVVRDKIRPAGTADWFEVGQHPSLVNTLPQKENPETEILEPPFHSYQKHQGVDDDIDMIPLIDVSLVLLVYFLMSTSSLGSGTSTKLPIAEYASVQGIKDQAWIEVENNKAYTVGFAERKKDQTTKFESQDKLIAYLQDEIKKGQGFKEVTVYAPGDISAGTIRTLVTSIEKSFGKDEISKIHLGVTGKK